MGYPIFFKLICEVSCAQFGARVTVSGRALMALEDSEWWCHGVDPGAITASGTGPGMAFAAFRMALSEVFEDIACDARDFDAFREAAGAFVVTRDADEAARWEVARRAIRAGNTVDWMFGEPPSIPKLDLDGTRTAIPRGSNRISGHVMIPGAFEPHPTTLPEVVP